MCRRRGAIMVSVPVDELTIEAGDTLSLYTFNTKAARHYFCSVCGIYTHHLTRSDPSKFGVNLGCVEGADIRAADRRSFWYDGVNHPGDRAD